MKMQKFVIFVNKNLKNKDKKIKIKKKRYCNIRNHCHYTGEYKGSVDSICNFKYNVPKKIPIVFNNESNYDYQFIIKALAEEIKKQFNCLGENTEKCITLTVPIENEVTRFDKNEDKVAKNISYILQFIDSARFMASSLCQ